jgi:phage I-like protein
LKKEETVRIVCGASQMAGTNEIQLLPHGLVKRKNVDFISDAQARKEMIEHFNSEKNDVVVDYEHQTLKDVQAPAAGWIKELIDKGKDGLWARVEWTQKAQEYIASKEYRYLSPVVLARKSDRRAVLLHSVALTNKPAIDGMEPLANKDEEGNGNMDLLKQLTALLKLPDTATEQDVIDAVTKLTEAGSKVALKDYIPMDAYTALVNKNKELEGLLVENKKQEIKGVVELALKEGKVTPAMKEWAEMYAMKDPDGFNAFMKNAPAVVPLNKVPDANDKRKVAVGESQLVVNKMLGITNEDFNKYGGVEDGVK